MATLRIQITRGLAFALVVSLLLVEDPLFAADKPWKDCPDGKHGQIDIEKLKIQYSASEESTTLLSFIDIKLSKSPKTLQIASEVTQQWNEYLKGLAEGYNTCAITKAEYNNGLQNIFPKLKSDGKYLKKLLGDFQNRQDVSAQEQKERMARFESLLKSYYNKLSQFAKLSDREYIIDKINEKFKKGIESVIDSQRKGDRNIIARIDQMEANLVQRVKKLEDKILFINIPKPQTIKTKLSKKLFSKIEQAQKAYETGYENFQQARYEESIPYFHKALKNIPTPEFYASLGKAHYLWGTEILERPFRTDADHKKGYELIQEGEKYLIRAVIGFKEEDEPEEEAQINLALGEIYLHQKLGKDPKSHLKAISYFKKGLDVLDCGKFPMECILGYGNTAAAWEWMPSTDWSERQDNLEKSMQATERIRPLAQNEFNRIRYAHFERNQAVEIGHYFRGGRDKNLKQCIQISKQALPILKEDKESLGTHVLLLNHIATCYTNLDEGNRIERLHKARNYLNEGIEKVGPKYFPEYFSLLKRNLKVVDYLLKHDGMLTQSEQLGRYSAKMEEQRKRKNFKEASKEAFNSLVYSRKHFGNRELILRI